VLGLASLWISGGSARRVGVFGFSVYLHCYLYLGHLIQRNVECLFLEGLPILGCVLFDRPGLFHGHLFTWSFAGYDVLWASPDD
jgi:hypothetical protein